RPALVEEVQELFVTTPLGDLVIVAFELADERAQDHVAVMVCALQKGGQSTRSRTAHAVIRIVMEDSYDGRNIFLQPPEYQQHTYSLRTQHGVFVTQPLPRQRDQIRATIGGQTRERRGSVHRVSGLVMAELIVTGLLLSPGHHRISRNASTRRAVSDMASISR